MTKSTLAEKIIKSIEDDEWKMIEDGSGDVYISDHNRKVLQDLRERGLSFSGDVDEREVMTLSEALYGFLKETWPEKPMSHKYVVNACLVLTFLIEEPMHPQDAVKFKIVERDGKKVYFCPAKQDSIICNFCISEKLN